MAIKIPFLNTVLVNQNNWEDINKSYLSLKAAYQNMRHAQTEVARSAEGRAGLIPYWPLPMKDLMSLFYHSDVLRTVLNVKKQELFRNGYEWEPKFSRKCIECNKEYEHNVDVCDCGGAVRDPDETETQNQDEFFKCVNANGQTLMDVMSSVEDDVNIFDNGYIIMAKEYNYVSGQLLTAKVREIFRGEPMTMRMVVSSDGTPGLTKEGNPVLACPFHRNDILIKPATENCPKCGKPLRPVYYIADNTVENQSVEIAYFRGEVYHVKRYTTGIGYGYPPLFSIWRKVGALIQMERHILMYYQYDKPPRSLTVINTTNADSVEKALESLRQKAKSNPYDMFPLINEYGGGETPKNVLEHTDLTKTLEEMQYTQVREEFRKGIGMLYGVMPVFMGESSPGLGREGLEIAITNRAIEQDQGSYNDGIFPWIIDQFGVQDWNLKLPLSERRDKLGDLEVQRAMIEVAERMSMLGFEPELVPGGEYGFEFRFSPTRKSTPTMSALGPEEFSPDTAADFEGSPEEMGPSRLEQRYEGEPLLPRKSISKQLEPYEFELKLGKEVIFPHKGVISEITIDSEKRVNVADVSIENDKGESMVQLTQWKKGKTVLSPRKKITTGDSPVFEKYTAGDWLKIAVRGLENPVKVRIYVR